MKSFKFVLGEGNNPITFNPSLILLPTKVDFILEEQDYKRDAFLAFDFSSFEIVFVLPIEVITFYIQISKV